MPLDSADSGHWTYDTLLLHLSDKIDSLDQRMNQRFDDVNARYEQRFQDSDKATRAALAAAEKAVTKAETAAEKRFESVNEFRASLSDQAAQFLPRSEYDTAHDNLVERFNELNARVTRTEGRSTGVSSSWGYLVGAIVVINAVFAVVMLIAG